MFVLFLRLGVSVVCAYVLMFGILLNINPDWLMTSLGIYYNNAGAVCVLLGIALLIAFPILCILHAKDRGWWWGAEVLILSGVLGGCITFFCITNSESDESSLNWLMSWLITSGFMTGSFAMFYLCVVHPMVQARKKGAKKLLPAASMK